MSLAESEIHAPVWRKARRSISNGDCVEVCSARHAILVRDSKDPEGPVLRYSVATFRSFVDAAKRDIYAR